MDFPEALNRLRKEAGLSLNALAKRANCSKSVVGHAATGARLPSDQLVLALDRALHASGMLVAIARSTRLHKRSQPIEPGAGAPAGIGFAVRLHIEETEVLLRLDRRDFLRSGAPFLMAAVGLDPHVFTAERLRDQTVIASSVTVLDVLRNLSEHWHQLVQIDNLRGPQSALDGVRSQLAVIEGVVGGVRGSARSEMVRIGAQYAESAAWLYEDLDDMTSAKRWTSRAAEWSYEAGDGQLLAWTMYRKAQQAAAEHDPGRVIGLTSAVLAREEDLPAPIRAAVRVQQAHGYALDGDFDVAQRLLDDAHHWAATDVEGDARAGHGSFCTPSYIELNRAACFTAVFKPGPAIDLFQRTLPTVPTSYQRDKTAYEIKLAAAHAMNGDVEQAAQCVVEALPTMASTGSRRMIREVTAIAEQLRPHRAVPAVADMLDATTARRERAQ